MTPGFRESCLTTVSHSLYLASEFHEHQGGRVARTGDRGHVIESPSPLLAVPDILALFLEPHTFKMQNESKNTYSSEGCF